VGVFLLLLDKQVRPFLDSIPVEFPDYTFLTLLSTTKDMDQISILHDWAKENNVLYLQTAFEDRLHSNRYPYLLEPKHSIYDHLTAAIKIATYFNKINPEVKLEKVLDGYMLYKGEPLAELLYHKLLKTEVERNMIHYNNPESKITGDIVNKCFDKATRFLEICFKNNAEDLIMEIDGKKIQLHYTYMGKKFTVDLQIY